MRKLILGAALLLALPLTAEENTTEEYIGRVTNIHMGKSNEVKVGIELAEDETIDCFSDDWPLYFEIGESYSASWLDFLLLVNRTRDKVRIGYQPNANSNCMIEYIAIMEQDGVLGNGDDVTGDPSLTRTGQYGNVALINSNDLKAINYSSSHSYGSDKAASAFDGHILNESINSHADEMISRGIWLMKKAPNDEQWLQVEFNDFVEVSGFRVVLNQQSVDLGRLPKEIIIQASDDGISYADYDTFTLNKTKDQRALLTGKISLRYFRILINSNYGDSFIEIDELEVFAD